MRWWWVLLGVLAGISGATAGAEGDGADGDWWLKPHRLLQTNLREIDATMDLDRYVEEVQAFGANIVLFNVGGIVANYPTELENHWRNPFMEGDVVGEALSRLHAADIKMMGRFDFSKLNEAFAAKHPDWLYVSEKGGNVNYNGQVHTCVMGGYQQAYMLEILKEALTRYELDGVFFNMIGFPQTDYSRVFHGICQCRNCQQSFREYAGMPLPKHDGDPAALTKHGQWKNLQISRQFERVREVIKSIRPRAVICTYTANHVDVIRRESNAPLGEEPWDDLERAQWSLLTHPDKQLANASVHFYAMIFRHAAAGPYLHSRRLWQQMVNGAWLDFYCIGPLQRLEDRAGLGPAGDVFRFHAAHEDWLVDTESAAEVGLVRRDGEDYQGWLQLLAEHHVPFDLVSLDHSDLPRYRGLIVPESDRIGSREAKALDAYVQEGGNLLLSGRMPEDLACLGRPRLVKTWPARHSMYVRIRPEDKTRLAVDGLRDFDLVQLRGPFHEYGAAQDTQDGLRLIHDVMYGPPEKCYYRSVSDIPALWTRSFERGRAALLPFQIGAMYREWGNAGHGLLAVGVLDDLLETNRRLRVETSPMVEVTHRRNRRGDFEWVSLYNHSGRLGNSFHPPIPVADVRIRLATDRPVRRVRSLTDGTPLPVHRTERGELATTLPRLNAFEVVLVEYAGD